MSLRPVREREVPAPQAAPAPAAGNATEPKSESSFDPSRLLGAMAMLEQIRTVLNARASVVIAMVLAASLTWIAMEKATGMALAAAGFFDFFIFIPAAYIAYLRRKEN